MNKFFKTIAILFFFSLNISAQQVSEINPCLNSKPWPAKWISFPESSNYGVYLFRKELIINAKPEKYIIHISADNRYKLYINGKYVCNGPARGYLFKWNFESLNIADYLHSGKNTICAVVWDFSNSRPLAQMSGQTGLIIQGNSTVESAINTDSSWIVFNDIAYKPVPVNINQYFVAGDGEEFNAEKHPWNWMENDYAALLQWKQAKEAETVKPVGCFGEWGGASSHLLHQREIPLMEEKTQRLFSIRRSSITNIPDGFLKGKSSLTLSPNSKTKILLDQNVLTTAYPVVAFSKGKSSKIKITYSESLFDKNGEKGNRNEIENKEIIGNSDIVICDGGNNRSYQTLWWRAFRYIELEIETKDEPLLLNDIYSIFTAYPFKEKASFKSNNPVLNDIWTVGWRTQRLCGNETFFDCPYYEQLQYIGDARIQALVSTYVSGDSRLAKNAIATLHESQLPFGITQSRYPSNQTQIIPTFSLVWVTMVYDYWMLNGDSTFIKSMIPGIMGTLDWFKARIDTSGMMGPVEWWNFVDWVNSKDWERGAPSAITNGNSSIVSLQYVYTLEKAAKIFEAFKMNDIALAYKQTATSIKKAVYQKCFSPDKGLIADSPEKKSFSQHANALAIITNTFPEKTDKSKVLNTILNDVEVAQSTLYFSFYLFEALDNAGETDKFIGLLKPWKKMLDNGLTTFAETPDPTRSDCHAWSASPVYYFLSLIAGIKPAEPGFKSVLIEPHFGDLKNIEASLPIQQGDIKVHLSKDTEGLVSGEIVLPNNVEGEFNLNNIRIHLKSGMNKLEKQKNND